jgi:Protein of unknown function (DUF2442)
VIPWDVVEVKIIDEHLIAVTFADGLQGKVHMGRLINSNGAGVFERLRDPSVFEQVHIEHGTLVWPGEIDLPPHVMHDAIERDGVYVP